VAVIGWEEHTLRKAQSSEIRQIIADLRQWSLSRDSLTRVRLQTELEARIDRFNAPEALVSAIPPDLFDNFLGTKALSHWGEKDRGAALAWLSTQVNPPEYRLSVLLDQWIVTAPVAAENYIRDLPAGPWRNRVLAHLATDAIQHGFPQRAISLIERMPPGATTKTLLNSAVREWARRDEESLHHWIESRPDDHRRAELSMEMRQALAEHSDNE